MTLDDEVKSFLTQHGLDEYAANVLHYAEETGVAIDLCFDDEDDDEDEVLRVAGMRAARVIPMLQAAGFSASYDPEIDLSIHVELRQ